MTLVHRDTGEPARGSLSRNLEARRSRGAQPDTLGAVLDAVRLRGARTRPEIASCTELGRSVVSQRVAELITAGLIAEQDPDTSADRRPGRPGRTLRFVRTRGHILTIEVGASNLGIGIADLGAQLGCHWDEPAEAAGGPERIFQRASEIYDELKAGSDSIGELWGVGVSVPGDVDFDAGRMSVPSTMPAWDTYPIRQELMERFGLPVWVDNDANALAIGEAEVGRARGVRDVIFVKIGTRIGAGIISGGMLQRGAWGCAGDLGHIRVADDSPVICTCGKAGCLSAVSGSAALCTLATAAAARGASPYLAQLLESKPTLSSADLADAVSHGDPAVIEIITRAGHTIGEVLAAAINLLNPALIVVGGGLSSAGDTLLAAVRESIYRGSLPLAARDLVVLGTSLPGRGGLIGLASLVIDELFAPAALASWFQDGHPACPSPKASGSAA